MPDADNNTDSKLLTEADWKERLTPEQYRVLRKKGTEIPGSGRLLHSEESGEYICAGCGKVLFKSSDKYESTIPGLVGWPSFADVVESDSIELRDDNSMYMHRTEAVCRGCGGHLGHLFPDDSSPTGQHYCINSASLDFKKAEAR